MITVESLSFINYLFIIIIIIIIIITCIILTIVSFVFHVFFCVMRLIHEPLAWICGATPSHALVLINGLLLFVVVVVLAHNVPECLFCV